MANPLSGLGSIAENAASEAVAFGLGFALGRVLDPAGTALEQEAWIAAIDTSSGLGRALDPGVAAAIVAEALDQLSFGEQEAKQHGMTAERFDLLVKEVYSAPGFGELVRMLRRGSITSDLFTHGLRKAKLPTDWDTGLTELANERLDPAVIADGIQRRVLPDPGYLEGALPIDGSDVPILAVSGIDPVTEAAASGIDSDRLSLLAKSAGLPPSPGELLQLLNRGDINEAAFGLGVAQGHTRNEWGPFLLKLKRRLLSPHEYAELQLRDWITTDDMHAGAALSGMEQADVDLLFKMLGRPLNVHAITTGLARGGSYGGDYAGVPEPYNKALRESNIRPEWGNLAYANRYNLPSPFVMRALTQTGVWNEAKAEQRLLDAGWIPEDAKEAAAAWSGGQVAKSDPHVTKAETQLWSALHKSYVDDLTDDAQADAHLTQLGVAATAHAEILALWKDERSIVRRSLTAAQIKKTVGLKTWTDAERMARLTELGYTTEDATTFLAE